MKQAAQITSEADVTEIIELATDQLDLLTRSFEAIAEIAQSGKLTISSAPLEIAESVH